MKLSRNIPVLGAQRTAYICEIECKYTAQPSNPHLDPCDHNFNQSLKRVNTGPGQISHINPTNKKYIDT